MFYIIFMKLKIAATGNYFLGTKERQSDEKRINLVGNAYNDHQFTFIAEWFAVSPKYVKPIPDLVPVGGVWEHV